jgi:alpha-galactosidase
MGLLEGKKPSKEGVAKVEEVGRFVGLYVASKTVRKDSPLFKETRMEDWLLRTCGF